MIAFLDKHKPANHGTDRKRPSIHNARDLERGRNGRVQSTLRRCRPIDGCSLACSLRKEVPSGALSLRRAYNAPLQSAVHLPSTLSTKTAKSCHISVFLMQFGSVDKASSILFSVFSDCTLGSALFAYAVFIAVSDNAPCHGTTVH